VITLSMTLLALAPGHAGAATLQAADTTPPPTAGWTYYPVGATLINTTTTTLTGTAIDGGCEYDVTASGTAATTEETVEVGENASTCTAQFESGTPTDFTTDTTEPSGSADTSTNDSGLASNATPTGTDPSSYQDNKWLDPLGIQVNAQEQWLSWNTGYCNVSWTAKWKWSWLGDGWSMRWSDHSAGSDCSRAINRADSAFRNPVFCVGVTTYTYFGWNESTTTRVSDNLRGYYNGSWEWDYHDFKNGGCSGLLHHGHIFKYS